MQSGRRAWGSAHAAANPASQVFAQTNVGLAGSHTGGVALATTVVDVLHGGVSFHVRFAPLVDVTAKSNALSPGPKLLGRAWAVSAANRFCLPYGIVTV